MKKKILGISLMAAIALAAGWNIGQSENEVSLTDVALINVEALAKDESSPGCTLNLLKICETSNGDHHFYRNN